MRVEVRVDSSQSRNDQMGKIERQIMVKVRPEKNIPSQKLFRPVSKKSKPCSGREGKKYRQIRAGDRETSYLFVFGLPSLIGSSAISYAIGMPAKANLMRKYVIPAPTLGEIEEQIRYTKLKLGILKQSMINVKWRVMTEQKHNFTIG